MASGVVDPVEKRDRGNQPDDDAANGEQDEHDVHPLGMARRYLPKPRCGLLPLLAVIVVVEVQPRRGCAGWYGRNQACGGAWKTPVAVRTQGNRVLPH